MKPLQIAIISPLYHPHSGGGIESYLLELVSQLKLSGHKVTVICTGPSDGFFVDAGYGEMFNVRRPAFHHLTGRLTSRSSWLLFHLTEMFSTQVARKFIQIIERKHFDVILSQSFFGLGRGLPQLLRKHAKRWVHFVHGYDLVCMRQTAVKKSQEPCARQCSGCRRICGWKYGQSSLSETAMIFNSAFMSRFCHAAGIRGRETHVVAPVLPKMVYEPAALYQISSPVRLVYVGRLTAEKGVHILCEVVSRYPSAFQLEILGDGPMLAALRQRFGDLIHFRGQVEPAERDCVLRDGHALVVPSLWNEPFGRVVYEGLLIGVPVIASRTGGIPEMIVHGGDGFLFDWERGGETRSLEGALFAALPLLPQLRIGALRKRAELMRTDNFSQILQIITATSRHEGTHSRREELDAR